MEAGVDADPNLEVTDPSLLFDFYLNTCPSQGSRTIRTEVGLLLPVLPLAVTHGPQATAPVPPQKASGWPGAPQSNPDWVCCRRPC